MTREEAIDVLKHNYPSACFTDLCEAVGTAIQALSEPEQKKGKWVKWGSRYKCNQCNLTNEYKKPFCPNCGADMRGEQGAARATGEDQGNAAMDVLMPGC